jgi:hypothetical protein
MFHDHDVAYDLPVTDLECVASADDNGFASVSEKIARAAAARQNIILRIGLARAFDGGEARFNPRRCYAQVNGLIFQC